jgi:hypothetical protein
VGEWIECVHKRWPMRSDGWTKGKGVFTGNIKGGGHVNGGGGVVAVM